MWFDHKELRGRRLLEMPPYGLCEVLSAIRA